MLLHCCCSVRDKIRGDEVADGLSVLMTATRAISGMSEAAESRVISRAVDSSVECFITVL